MLDHGTNSGDLPSKRLATWGMSVSMSETCPKCHAQDWKSAKLVVLEGTTKTKGSLEGELVEKGALRGSVRDFLLSDRWFSYESPITAEFASITTSVLVDEVKALLVSEGAARPMPLPPEKPVFPQEPTVPTKLARDQGKFFAGDPTKIAKPKPPKEPEDAVKPLGEFEPNTWWKNFKDQVYWSIIFVAILMTGYSYFMPESMTYLKKNVAVALEFVPQDHPFSQDVEVSIDVSIPFLSEWIRSHDLSEKTIKVISYLFMFLVLLAIRMAGALLTTGSKEKIRRKKWEEKLSKAGTSQKEAQEKYEVKLEEYRDKVSQWSGDIEQFEREREVYQQQLIAYQNQMRAANAIYERKLTDYDSEVAEVDSFRNELWERTRMCTRCGTSYLGPRPQA